MANDFPKISIVTPSFNQGKFIRATIESIISQNYPNLEYIVIDGGSVDESRDIIESYRGSITKIVIEKDKGAADAIIKGFGFCTGEWFNWINSDDVLLPNSLHTLSTIVRQFPDKKWVSGGRVNIFEDGRMAECCVPWRTNFAQFAYGDFFFPQDATFLRADFLRENISLFKSEFSNVFDTFLYYHLCELEKPLLTSVIFSAMRWHKEQKTAQLQQLNKERMLLDAMYQRQPVIAKMFSRVARTRAHREVCAFILFLCRYGCWPEICQWEALVFDEIERRWRKTKVSDMV